MTRPRWFPPILLDTAEADAQAILECQGDWWLWGGSMCKKPALCVADRACYFVETARGKEFPKLRIVWHPGFDDDMPVNGQLSLFEAA